MLAYEFMRVRLGHASAIDDPAFRLPENSTDEGMDFLDILGSGGFPGSDCPNRFVGDIDLGRILDSGEPLHQLDFQDLFRQSRFFLPEILTDTEDRADIMRKRRLHFSVYKFIGLAEYRSALGMSEYDVSAIEFLKHERRSFSRIGSGIFIVHVLGSEMDTGIPDQFRCECESGGDRRNHEIDRPETRIPGNERPEILAKFRRSFIHLEIRTDEEIHSPFFKEIKDMRVYRKNPRCKIGNSRNGKGMDSTANLPHIFLLLSKEYGIIQEVPLIISANMTEHPKQNAAPEVSEKLSDISNISIISNGFQNIADKYLASQKTNPKGARELALKHLQELKDSLGKYKEMPNGKKLMAEYAANGMGSTPQALILSQTETNIHDVQILLEGTDTRAILNIIDEHNTGTGSRLPFVLQFLPEEYTKDGKLTEKTLKQAKIEGTSRQMNEFLNDKQSKHIPFFDSDVFEKYPDIIEKALSKPGVILNSYEEIRGFDSNEEFAKMFNRILAREYPDFFGKAQKTKWYNDGGIDIEKMTILLDIVKYRPPERQKHFIDMMDGLENGEAERAVDIYQEYFIGTEIGREIPIRFAHSGLQSHLKKDTLKTLEKHEQGRVEEGSIYHIINTNKKVRNRAAEWFSTMPKNTLEIFLSHLPEIETHCSTGNMEALIKSMDSLQVDIVYKIPFLWGLAEIKSGSGADKNKDRDVEFYLKMAEHYKEQTDVTEENEKLSEQKLKYSIISKAFSGSGPEKQKQKNADFEKFLDETIEGNQYKFNVTTLKDKLRKIFSGTPEAEEIFKKIEASKDGKEIFKILSEAYTEQKSQQSAELRNDGFDGKKWEIFQKRNPKESRDILGKLKNPSMSTEEKIRILRDFIDPTKIPKDATEKELFINSIIVKLADFSKTTKKTEIVSEEHFKDFSASWQSGDFTAFNKKTQEREEKKEKEEEMRKQQEPKQ